MKIYGMTTQILLRVLPKYSTVFMIEEIGFREYSRIKKAIPQEQIRMLKSEPERGGGTYKMSNSVLNERECIFFLAQIMIFSLVK